MLLRSSNLFIFWLQMSKTCNNLLVLWASKALNLSDELICDFPFSRWVSFNVAMPFLDRMAYVVLSDCALFPNGVSSAPNASSEQAMEVQHNDLSLEDSNDVYMHQADEVTDPEFEISDDESSEESSDPESVQLEAGDINNILIELKGTCLKYKVCDLHCLYSQFIISYTHRIVFSECRIYN